MDKKNINFKKLMIIIIVLSIIFFLIIALIIFNDGDKKKNNNIKKSNEIVFTDKDKYKDAEIITNENFKKNHCIDSICINNLIIYKSKDYYNIELKIKNKSKKIATGYLKVIFNDIEIPVVYNNLKSNDETIYTIEFDKEMKLGEDYKVKKLTKKEIENIKG